MPDTTWKTYVLHFDGIDGAFTLERTAPSLKAAYRLALVLAEGRCDCFVRGVEVAADEPIVADPAAWRRVANEGRRYA
jgi:hypothetical protein